MSVNKSALKAFERRLLEDEKQLHKLMYESGGSSDEVSRRKLEFFENELKYMQKQYTSLYTQVTGQLPSIVKDKKYSMVDYEKPEPNKGMMVGTHIASDGTYVSAVTVANKKAEEEQGTTASKDIAPKATVPEAKATVTSVQITSAEGATVNGAGAEVEQPSMQEYETYEVKEIPKEILNAATPVEKAEKSGSIFTDDLDIRDLETFIGKNFMAIAASVLIFIGVILFAVLMLPNITDEIKMAAMYVVSAIFLCFGFVRIGKDKEDKFALVLLGCGAGVLYISLIMSNIYFKVIGDIPLYVLIMLWSLGVVYLARYKSELFMAIGHIGITISMIFGAISCSDTHDGSMLIALIIFYIISAGVFNAAFYNKNIVKNIFNHMMNAVNVIILYNGMVGCFEEEGLHVAGVLIIIITAVILGLILSSDVSQDTYFILPIALVVSMVCLCVEFNYTISAEVMGIIIYLISMAVLVILDRKKWDMPVVKMVSMAIPMVFMVIGIWQIDLLKEHFVPLMIVVPCLAYGYYRRDDMLKYGALVIFAGYDYLLGMEIGLDMSKVSSIELFTVGVVVFAGMYLCIYFIKSQYDKTYKYLVHVMACIHLFLIGCSTLDVLFENGDIAFGVAYMMATILNLIMLKVFCKDYENDEEEENIVYVAINAIFMLLSLYAILAVTVEPLHIMIIMTAIVSFMVNCKHRLEDEDNIWQGIYVGGKFVVLLIVSLVSFEADGFIISIACFVFAILSIALGFWRKYKSLRIFGLVLSMLSIFKLIVVDLSTGDEMGNVISFLSAGLLCLAISMLYNYIDKRMPKE